MIPLYLDPPWRCQHHPRRRHSPRRRSRWHRRRRRRHQPGRCQRPLDPGRQHRLPCPRYRRGFHSQAPPWPCPHRTVGRHWTGHRCKFRTRAAHNLIIFPLLTSSIGHSNGHCCDPHRYCRCRPNRRPQVLEQRRRQRQAGRRDRPRRVLCISAARRHESVRDPPDQDDGQTDGMSPFFLASALKENLGFLRDPDPHFLYC